MSGFLQSRNVRSMRCRRSNERAFAASSDLRHAYGPATDTPRHLAHVGPRVHRGARIPRDGAWQWDPVVHRAQRRLGTRLMRASDAGGPSVTGRYARGARTPVQRSYLTSLWRLVVEVIRTRPHFGHGGAPVEKVIPEVPVRQWVCSLPWRLRVLLGCDRRLCADVLEAFCGGAQPRPASPCEEGARALRPGARAHRRG